MIKLIMAFPSVVGVLLLLQRPPIPINPDKPLDVCTVLRNLQDYRTKIIAVRGRWDGPDIEADCGVSDDNIGNNRFGVAYLQNRILQRHPHEQGLDEIATWPEDKKAVEEATKEYDRLIRQGHNVLATFIGRLEARPPDKKFDFGYGHLGAYREQLVLMTIKDVGSETGKPARKPPEDKDLISIDR